MDPRASLDIMEHKKISCPFWDSNPGPPSPHPDHYIDFAIPAPPMALEKNKEASVTRQLN